MSSEAIIFSPSLRRSPLVNRAILIDRPKNIHEYPTLTIGPTSSEDRKVECLIGRTNRLHLSLGENAVIDDAAIAKILSYVRELRNEFDRQKTSKGAISINEEDQRALNSIKTFLDGMNERAPPLNALWKEIGNLSRDIKIAEVSQYKSKTQLVEFDNLFAGYSEKQLELIGKNICFIQLNNGCSVNCNNCSVNALSGPRRALSWDCVNEMVDRWGESLKKNDVFFYYASDPFNWEVVDSHTGEKKTYKDLVKLLNDKLGFEPYSSTALPRSVDDASLVDFWQKSGSTLRISSSVINAKRVGDPDMFRALLGAPAKADSNLSVHGTNPNNELKLPLGKAYDFRSIQNSTACRSGVVIKPDGIYNLEAAMVTPLSHNNSIEYQITPDTKNIVKKANHVDANRNRFKALELENTDDEKVHLPLTDLQVIQGIIELVSNNFVSYELLSHNLDGFRSGTTREKSQGVLFTDRLGSTEKDIRDLITRYRSYVKSSGIGLALDLLKGFYKKPPTNDALTQLLNRSLAHLFRINLSTGKIDSSRSDKFPKTEIYLRSLVHMTLLDPDNDLLVKVSDSSQKMPDFDEVQEAATRLKAELVNQ